jgi:hypothetical protein
MDNILKTGDQAQFNSPYGKAATIPPVMTFPLAGSGRASNGQVPICVEGDEKKVMVPCSYVSPPFVTPGAGILTIKALGSDQLSQKTKSAGRKVMLKGTFFDSQLQVTVPATQPTPGGPVPDATPMYSGKGQFITTNVTVQDKG